MVTVMKPGVDQQFSLFDDGQYDWSTTHLSIHPSPYFASRQVLQPLEWPKNAMRGLSWFSD